MLRANSPCNSGTPKRYGYVMALVRHLEEEDVAFIVSRVARRLTHEAQQNPLINAHFDADAFETALHGARGATWVCDEGSLTGHIYGAALQGSSESTDVWIGPDGVSFDSVETLRNLFETALSEWRTQGAKEIFVWVLNDESSIAPWHELGFEVVHEHGVLRLAALKHRGFPPGYKIRLGGREDLSTAIALDDLLELHQGGDADSSRASREEDLTETIEDPDTSYFIVEYEGDPVAHCVSFPLPPRRSSHDATAHLSDVVVIEQHRRSGIATALIDEALSAAKSEGAEYAEVNWRSTNLQAKSFWLNYGFTSTYVRLRATLD